MCGCQVLVPMVYLHGKLSEAKGMTAACLVTLLGCIYKAIMAELVFFDMLFALGGQIKHKI